MRGPDACHHRGCSMRDGRGQATPADIAQGLRTVGLAPAFAVLVHSSLSATGYLDGGADAVAEGLLDAVGPEGLAPCPPHPWPPPPRAPTPPPPAAALSSGSARTRSDGRAIHPPRPLRGPAG